MLNRLTFDFKLLLKLVGILFIYKYKRSLVLILFSICNTLALIFFISLVFSKIFNEDFFEKLLFIFSAYIPWNYFANSVLYSSGIFVNHSSILKNAPVEKIYFPLASCVLFLFEFLFLLIIYSVLTYIFYSGMNINLLLLILFVFLFFIFTLSISTIASVITVFFRDFPSFLTSLIQITFFLTPVIYDKDKLFNNTVNFEIINPLIVYISGFRNLLFNQNSSVNFNLSIFFTIFFLLISLFIFSNVEKKISVNL